MSPKKKHSRNKSYIYKKKLGCGLVGFFFILLICYAFYSFSHLSNANGRQTSQFKAAIVDHLSLSQPNQTFIQTATTTLETAGFTVDYYKGEEVNVEFYRNLPKHGYSLIILRVHSALGLDMGPSLALFTSELYSKTKYVYEQLTTQLVRVTFYEGQKPKEPSYFGIPPEFVRYNMNGKFENTIIIMMGCNGLTNTNMAKAFIEKGAKVYISWSGSVLASHTDLATKRLLQHFLLEKRTLKESVRETFKEAGFDPVYKSLLLYYPLEAGNYTIQVTTGNLITNTTEIKTKIKQYEIY